MKMLSNISRIAQFEIVLAIILVFFPLFLRLADGNRSWRLSISDYVYTDCGHIFGMFLTAAAFMFIYNGILNYRADQKEAQLKKNMKPCIERDHMINSLEKQKPPGKYYNIIFGISLLGVLLFPHLEYPIIHYIAAAVFFLGSIVVMGFTKGKKWSKTGMVLAIISTVSLGLSFVESLGFSLFWAEWIALIAIAIYYVLEANYTIENELSNPSPFM